MAAAAAAGGGNGGLRARLTPRAGPRGDGGGGGGKAAQGLPGRVVVLVGEAPPQPARPRPRSVPRRATPWSVQLPRPAAIDEWAFGLGLRMRPGNGR